MTQYPKYRFVAPRAKDDQIHMLFDDIPDDDTDLFNRAQNLRTNLSTHIAAKTPTQILIKDFANYLPMTVEIEEYLLHNSNITVDKKARLRWRFESVVKEKFAKRNVSGKSWNSEILFTAFGLGMNYFIDGIGANDAGDVELGIELMRKASGVFQTLSTDRLHVVGRSGLQPEFDPDVLNCLQNVAIGLACFFISTKSEDPKVTPSIISTCGNIFDSILHNLKIQKKCSHLSSKFVAWLETMATYCKGVASAQVALDLYSKHSIGKAIGIIRMSISDLESVLVIARREKKSIELVVRILNILYPLQQKWTQENSQIYSEVVPDRSESQGIVHNEFRNLPNLPSPIPFDLNSPSQ